MAAGSHLIIPPVFSWGTGMWFHKNGGMNREVSVLRRTDGAGPHRKPGAHPLSEGSPLYQSPEKKDGEFTLAKASMRKRTTVDAFLCRECRKVVISY